MRQEGPVQVWGQCAWVLWRETNFLAAGKTKPEITLAAVTGFPARSECIEGLRSERDKAAAADERSGAVVTKHDDGYGALHGWTMAVTYRCLPDTLDPRGKEGR